jgi:hypothetical protein
MTSFKSVEVALTNELDRRRRADLHRSLQNPHPESVELAEQGLQGWTRCLPEEDTRTLVNLNEAKPVRWVPGEGWRVVKRVRTK